MRYLRNCGIIKYAEFFMIGSAFFTMELIFKLEKIL